jgi:DNA-binding transcriptional ArsR family regulator
MGGSSQGVRGNCTESRTTPPARAGRYTLDDARVAPTAILLADAARAAMLWALSDGRALPAGELARVARVGAPTASAHLAKLVAGGLLAAERHGRHRYCRLATPAVVAALEAIAVLAPPARAPSAKAAHAGRAVRLARTCYDHLAGVLGVAVTEALVAQGALVLAGRAYVVTDDGAARFARLGIDVPAVAARSARPWRAACSTRRGSGAHPRAGRCG